MRGEYGKNIFHNSPPSKFRIVCFNNSHLMQFGVVSCIHFYMGKSHWRTLILLCNEAVDTWNKVTEIEMSAVIKNGKHMLHLHFELLAIPHLFMSWLQEISDRTFLADWMSIDSMPMVLNQIPDIVFVMINLWKPRVSKSGFKINFQLKYRAVKEFHLMARSKGTRVHPFACDPFLAWPMGLYIWV